MDDDRCRFTKDDGTPCRARRVHGSDYCFFHDPALATDRAAAQRAGGQQGRAAVLPTDTSEHPIKTAADVVGLLSQTIQQVRTGALDPRVGNCVGYLSGVILKAVEQGDLEERLAALEGIVRHQGRPEDLFGSDPDQLDIGEDDQTEPERASA